MHYEILFQQSQCHAAGGAGVIDGQTKEALEFHGRIVFLNASALESTRILLNTTSSEFPNGLANSSGQLGHNLMDHTMGGGASARIPGNEDKNVYGRRPNGIYVPRFRNVKSKNPNFLRGYGFQGGGERQGWERGTQLAGFGTEFKEMLSRPGPWTFDFYGFGECLPNPDNYIELDKEVKDEWGIPALRIHCKWRDNERALLKDM